MNKQEERRKAIEGFTEKGIQLLRAVMSFQKGAVIERAKREFDDSLERLFATTDRE